MKQITVMMSWPIEDLTKFSNDFVLIEDKKGSADIIEQANLDPKKIDDQKTINDQKLQNFIIDDLTMDLIQNS